MADERNVVEYKARDGQQIKLSPEIIKRYLVRGKPELVNNQELFYFMGVCKSRGMNPFINDCYLIKYNQDPAAVITSIDYYRKRAKAQADCKGWRSGIIIGGEGSGLDYREGTLLLDGERLLGAWFSAKPAGWDIEVRHTVNLKGYIKTRADGQVTKFWSPEKQPDMIAKVAEAQGLRKIWGDEFQGLYVDAERESAEAQADLKGAMRDIPSDSDQVPPVDIFSIFSEKPDAALLDKFLQAAADVNSVTVDEVKAEAIKDPQKFVQAYQIWVKQNHPVKPAPPDDKDPIREEYVRLKGKGFMSWVKANLQRIYAMDDVHLTEIKVKWRKLYQDTFPGKPITLATVPDDAPMQGPPPDLTIQDDKGSPFDDGGPLSGDQPPMELDNGNHDAISCPKTGGRSYVVACEKCPDAKKCQPLYEYWHETEGSLTE